jgi:hypothetical protein
MFKNKRILFILKKRSSYGISYGLVNSCKFVGNTLSSHGVIYKTVEVDDNNGIDKEVHDFNPTHVVIEALWVVTEKLDLLISKYSKIKWCVRIHSKMPFLSTEGIAIEWLWKYQNILKFKFDNFFIGSNAYDAFCELNDLGIETEYLPNIYTPIKSHGHIITEHKKHDNIVDVGCFGSIRPLKNQLQQAVSAVIFANSIEKKMRFHINSDRVEQKGDPILKNLENLFKNTEHELVKHDWMNHEEFLDLVDTMDIGLQVSFTESFNIVAADFAFKNVPIIGSYDIEWLNYFYKADPTDYQDIVKKLQNAYKFKAYGLQWLNKFGLELHNIEAVNKWLSYISE